MLTTLPCGHVYHASPRMPPRAALPMEVELLEIVLQLADFEDLPVEAYYGGWVCDICAVSQGYASPLYHSRTAAPGGLSGGFDACLRCVAGEGGFAHLAPSEMSTGGTAPGEALSGSGVAVHDTAAAASGAEGETHGDCAADGKGGAACTGGPGTAPASI